MIVYRHKTNILLDKCGKMANINLLKRIKRMRKRLISAAAAIIMIFAMLPVNAVAQPGSSSQITFAGGTTPEDGGLNADGVSVSKIIYGTDRENYFDIELTAKTTQKLEELLSVDVVLVMDISNTMNETAEGSLEKRLDIAKDAVWKFSSDFLTAIPNGIDVSRRLAFVTFDTDAHTVIPWKERTDLDSEAELNELKNSVYAVTTESKESHERFTNIEAGLTMAKNLLKTSNAEHKYVVLFTDGFPTTYIDVSSGTKNSTSVIQGYDPYTSEGTVGEDGVFYNERQGAYCTYSTSYSDKAALRAEQAALDLKKSGVNIFSVGICENDDMSAYLSADSQTNLNSGFSVIDCFSGSGKDDPNYYIGRADGNKKPSMNHGASVTMTDYERWLGGVDNNLNADPSPAKFGKGIGSGFDRYYFHGDDSNELSLAVKKITEDLEAALKKTSCELWVAKDPVPHDIEFLFFYGKNGEKSESLTGEYAENGGNTAAFNENSINWQLMNSGFSVSTETVNGTPLSVYTYKLKYAVRLKNEGAEFKENTDYATNGKTELEYKTVNPDGSSKTDVIEFALPSVKGYLCELAFKKTNTSGKPLADAHFLLVHDAACSVCGGEVEIQEMTSVSDENGNITFLNIPSGHNYTLKETAAPKDYILSDVSYAVVASYDKLTVNGKTPSEFTVENVPFAPVSIAFAAKKELTGKPLNEGEFLFGLFGADGNMILEAANSVNGSVVFDAVSITSSGEHTYTVKEIIPHDRGYYTYDESVYTAVVTVLPDSEKGVLKVENVSYSKDGTPADILEFHNVFEAPPVNVSLEAHKVYRFSKLMGNDFEFMLYAANETFAPVGDALQIKKNAADGSISFDDLVYDSQGVYRYTVLEHIPEEQNGRVVFDNTVYHVTVTVTQAPNGLLVPAVEISTKNGAAESMKFLNIYIPPFIPQTGDDSNMLLWIILSVMSAAGITVSVLMSVRKKPKE